MLRNLRNEARKGGKLEWVWSGPYTISKVLPKGLYNLRNEDGTKLKTSFDSSRLKIYYHSVQSHPNTIWCRKRGQKHFDKTYQVC